jgi:hydroxymethylpyrimidine/phosphomethylpyrimidine kinase
MASAARIPRVLSIAGSDSGGGAGIQADLKAFARCGVYGMTAITAITAQNTVRVAAVEAVSPAMIVAQVRAVVEDIGVDAVKIGMLGTVPTIEAVDEALDLLEPGTPVVLDPVMVAESGAELLEPQARDALVDRLLPRATVVTPNVAEAAKLAGAPGPGRPRAGARRRGHHRRPPRRGHRRLLRRDHGHPDPRRALPTRGGPRLRLHALVGVGRSPGAGA